MAHKRGEQRKEPRKKNKGNEQKDDDRTLKAKWRFMEGDLMLKESRSEECGKRMGS